MFLHHYSLLFIEFTHFRNLLYLQIIGVIKYTIQWSIITYFHHWSFVDLATITSTLMTSLLSLFYHQQPLHISSLDLLTIGKRTSIRWGWERYILWWYWGWSMLSWSKFLWTREWAFWSVPELLNNLSDEMYVFQMVHILSPPWSSLSSPKSSQSPIKASLSQHYPHHSKIFIVLMSIKWLPSFHWDRLTISKGFSDTSQALRTTIGWNNQHSLVIGLHSV